MRLSVIIPTLNEVHNIEKVLEHLYANSDARLAEIWVVDGQSADNTVESAQKTGALVVKSPRGRAIQMNMGVQHATGDVLYFVHADTLPPPSYLDDIEASLGRGFDLGCYRFAFDSPCKWLKVNAFFTRFDVPWTRGGDQSLFIRKEVFTNLNGFDEQWCIMEEYEFLSRARRQFAFQIMPKKILVSARKYEQNAYLKVQWANLRAFRLYRKGASPMEIKILYHSLLRHREHLI
jgi:rSAM/selenodomain-associated transferase 2